MRCSIVFVTMLNSLHLCGRMHVGVCVFFSICTFVFFVFFFDALAAASISVSFYEFLHVFAGYSIHSLTEKTKSNFKFYVLFCMQNYATVILSKRVSDLAFTANAFYIFDHTL